MWIISASITLALLTGSSGDAVDIPVTPLDSWSVWRGQIVAEMLTMDTNQSETQLEELVADYTDLGQQYDVDPLVMLSIAYYESRWNSCDVNRLSGCYGDLQVMKCHKCDNTAHGRRVWSFKRVHDLLENGHSLDGALIDWRPTRARGLRLFHKLLTKYPEPATICTDDSCRDWNPARK